jgi:hypothetical protein
MSGVFAGLIASVKAAILPAGGWISRISATGTGLAQYNSNLIIDGTSAYFAASDSNNIYGHIVKVDLSTPAVSLAKYQSDGGVNYNTDPKKSLQLDSSNNVLGIILYNDTNGGNYSLTANYNSSTLSPTVLPRSTYGLNYSLERAANGDTYYAGDDQYNYNEFNLNGAISKINANGTYGWGYTPVWQAGTDVKWITSDSSSNVIALLSYSSTIAVNYTSLEKLPNTFSGTKTWGKQLSVYLGGASSFNLSNNTYVAGRNWDNGDIHIVKIDSAGAVVWSRKIATGVAGEYSNNVSVYVETVSTVTSVYVSTLVSGKLFIASYSDSGTLNWQNILTPATGSFTVSGINRVGISGNGTSFIYALTGYVFSSNRDEVLVKIPTNGVNSGATSFTLSTKSFTYAGSSYTESAGGITVSNSPITYVSPGGIVTTSQSGGTQTTETLTLTNSTF